jgi:hypothetical protein
VYEVLESQDFKSRGGISYYYYPLLPFLAPVYASPELSGSSEVARHSFSKYFNFRSNINVYAFRFSQY